MQQLFLSQLVKGLPSNNMWKQIENLDANFFFFFSTWKTWLSIISFFDITYKCLLFAWEDSLYKDLPNEWCGLTNTMIYLDTWNLHGNIPMKRKDGSKNRLKTIQPIVNCGCLFWSLVHSSLLKVNEVMIFIFDTCLQTFCTWGSLLLLIDSKSNDF